MDEQREGESTKDAGAPAWPLVVVVALAALVAAFAPAGALQSGAAALAVLGAAVGLLLALSPGPIEVLKLLWLAAALSPPLVAALAFGARAALGDTHLELARTLALCAAALCASIGVRGRVRLQWPGLALASLHLLATAAALLAAAVWRGAGPEFVGLEFADWGPPRFALELAAGRELVPDSPWQAGVALQAPPVFAQARAALARVLDVGPLALASAEAAWAMFTLLLALAHVAARCFPRGVAVFVGVCAAFAAPAGVASVVAPVAAITRDALGGRIAFLDQTSAAALALVGLYAHLAGAAHVARPGAWRAVAGVCLGTAFLADVWIGGAFLGAALVAACTNRAALERALVLAAAALPGALVTLGSLRGVPPRALEATDVAYAAGWFAAALVFVFVARRSQRANADAVELAKFVGASALLAAALVAWLGAAAHAIVGWLVLPAALATVGAFALFVRRSALGVLAGAGLVAVLAVSAHGLFPTVTRGNELVRGAAPVVDAGTLCLAPRRDTPERVAEAWAGAPPPNVIDPRWREPFDVEEPLAADFAAAWHWLATDAAVQAQRPVLLVDISRPNVRWAGGLRLTFDGQAHEAAYLANLDLFVDRWHRAWRGKGEEYSARTLVAYSFFDDDGPGRAARARLEALGRPVLFVVGPAQRGWVQRSANVDVERRLIEFGCAPVRTCGEVSLFVWPSAYADALR